MTNAMTIFLQRVELMKNGIIEGTGNYIEVEINNEVVRIEEPEQIHTYAAWKQLGYQVKKGEHAIAKFQIWKYKEKKGKEEKEADGEQENKGDMFLKVSHFFKMSQVEKVA